MVSLLDRIVRRGFRFINSLFQTGSKTEEFEGFGGRESLVEESDRSLSKREFRRKFVSGLFYCGGIKRQFFAQTFEQNDVDRSDALLRELEQITSNCSDIRDNFGYSDDEVDNSKVSNNAIFPDVESGEL